MSWLSDFAGKAENFLNAMDKGAATAISNATTVIQQTAAVTTNSSSNRSSSGDSSSRKYSLKSDLDYGHDAEYIDTPDIISLKTSISSNSLYSGNGNGSTGHYTKGHHRTSSYDSVGSRGSKNGNTGANDDDFLKESNIPEEDWHPLEDSTATIDAEVASQKSHDSDHSDSYSISSSKQARLSQVKIEALSKELSSLQKRYSDLVSEYKQIQKKAIGYHNQNVTTDKSLKEARSKEADLLATLQTKDSQIAALKVQLEQIDAELAEKVAKLSALQQENRDLQSAVNAQEGKDSSQSVALIAEIEALKQSLKAERDELKRCQDSHREQVARLEDNQRSLIDQIESIRRDAQTALMAKAEAELTLGTLQKRLESTETEYSEFKFKASKTLQDKDELIRSLGVGKEDVELQQSAGISGGLDERNRLLQSQCDSLVSELTELQLKYDQVKAAADRAENETIPRQEFEIRTLRDQLKQGEAAVGALKADVRQLTEESKQYQDDLVQMRTSLSARLTERDEEIEKLRKQLVLKQQRAEVAAAVASEAVASSATAHEWEQRLKTLTENLIQKQATVEQLSSSNHSLKLQLERSEQRLREMTSSGTNLSNDVAIGIYHSPSFTNYIKHRMHGNQSMDGSTVSLLEDNPNDGQVTRKVKRVYGTIDAFSIRLGNFLRQYPSARAAFLVYIVVLHLWVAFIIMCYEPEVHNSLDGFNQTPKGL